MWSLPLLIGHHWKYYSILKIPRYMNTTQMLLGHVNKLVLYPPTLHNLQFTWTKNTQRNTVMVQGKAGLDPNADDRGRTGAVQNVF